MSTLCRAGRKLQGNVWQNENLKTLSLSDSPASHSSAMLLSPIRVYPWLNILSCDSAALCILRIFAAICPPNPCKHFIMNGLQNCQSNRGNILKMPKMPKSVQSRPEPAVSSTTPVKLRRSQSQSVAVILGKLGLPVRHCQFVRHVTVWRSEDERGEGWSRSVKVSQTSFCRSNRRQKSLQTIKNKQLTE
jgi:hypothetical protein